MDTNDEQEGLRYWQSRPISERIAETWRLSIEQAKKVGLYKDGDTMRKDIGGLLSREAWIKSEEESYLQFKGQ